MEGSREETVVQLRRLRSPSTWWGPSGRRRDRSDRAPRRADGRQATRAARREDGAAIAAVQKAVVPLGRPRVLLRTLAQPLHRAGGEARSSRAHQLAGGQSLTADDPRLYPRYSLEAAVARAPRSFCGRIREQQRVRSRWRVAEPPRAARGQGRAAPLGRRRLLHRYGPRLVDGLEQLARTSNPEGSDEPGPGATPVLIVLSRRCS